MKRTFAVLLLMALSAACRRTPEEVFIDPALAILIPENTKTLFGVRLDQIKKTNVYQQYLANRKIASLDELATKTGLDPRKDFHEILVAATSNDVLVLIHGKFGDAFGKQPQLKLDGVERTRYKGYEVIGTGDGSLCFLNSSVLALGKGPMIRTVIDNRDGGKAGVPATLKPLVNRIPYSAQMWATTVQPQALAQLPDTSNMGNINRLLQSLQRMEFAADFQEGLTAQVNGETATEQDAKQFRDMIKGVVGMLRLGTKTANQDLLKLLDSVQADAVNNKLKISVNIPPGQIDQIVNMLSNPSLQSIPK